MKRKNTIDPLALSLQIIFFSLFAGVFAVSCVYDFSPEGMESETGTIVIEGDIMAGAQSSFRISTTVSFTREEAIEFITNAIVWIESESGDFIKAEPSAETEGIFIANTANLDVTKKYQLCVDIPGRGSYRSALIPVSVTPPIDSITYHIGKDRSFVQLEVSTHSDDPENKYYKWNYNEDWEYHASEVPMLEYNIEKDIAEDVPYSESGKDYYCWNKDISSGIYVFSTEKLSNNTVYKQELNRLYSKDKKISYIYSILVSQISLTREGYTYWETLKKNTDQTGGIFAPQPSEMKGNIESITRPEEPVIGFISASTCTQKRIFLYHTDIRVYKNTEKCRYDTLAHFEGTSNLWRNAALSGNKILQYLVGPTGLVQKNSGIWVQERCVNCRLGGGNKNKPDFWPNDHK